MTPGTRTLCVWCPDWPVATARRARPELVGVPIATVQRIDGRVVVVAASGEARAEGIRSGLRPREAEARCPGLVVVDADPGADARTFEVVARAVEAITPRLVLERPGRLGFPTRGPSRYFGGDLALGARVVAAVRAVGVDDVHVGVADGGFAARLAARVGVVGIAHVVAPGTAAAFLAPLPVTVLGGDDVALADLLLRLGVTTLGAFAALPAPSVLARFGAAGTAAHRRAAGLDEHTVPPVPPPPDLAETAELDPPATRVDEAAFVAKSLADRLLGRLHVLGLSCPQVTVEAETEHGESLVRSWRHEGALTGPALASRVRWQLEGWLAGHAEIGEEAFVAGGLTRLRLAPELVVPAAGRQLGFWGGDAAARDRADRALTRLQGLLGHDAVVTAVPCGGRTPAERVRWIPWGDVREDPMDPINPIDLIGLIGPISPGDGGAWPGAVPGPAPARVFSPAVPAALLDATHRPVVVSGRGEASQRPAHLRCPMLPGGGGPVRTWAGPWVHDVRWWDRRGRRRRALWHIVVGSGDVDEVACLVGIEGGRASVEAIYD